MHLDYPHFEHPALTRFAPLAAAYCELLDNAAAHTAESLLQTAHSLLPQLYVAALALPPTGVLFKIEEDDTSTADEDDLTPLDAPDPDRGESDEWIAAYRALSAQLGAHNLYREIFDPYEPQSEPEVTASLADDLRDIHRDLLSGLRKWFRGESGEALWEWRFGFESHWGEHATGALRALHVRCSTYELPWPAPLDGAA
jgi:Domain of unknown function (DUF5063)